MGRARDDTALSDPAPALSRAPFDRAAERRRDPDWLATAWATGRLLVLDEEGRAVVGD
ncbi:MAG: hypothetical protein QOC82_1873, partial [Frankiaceae bacterium]|nr:hypothetical protein [Frankiaceae bacterium]